MKPKTKSHSYFLLLPLLLVLIAIPIEDYCIDFSRLIKFIALVFILINAIILKFKNVFVYCLIALILYLSFLIFYNNINIYQGLGDSIRYLFPIITLIYSIQLKELSKRVFLILIGYVLLNDFYQLISGIIFIFSVEQFVFVRATGFVIFFDFFGFINLIGLIILNELAFFKTSKYSPYLKIVFSLFIFWSLSLKIVILFLIYGAFKNRKLMFASLLFCLIFVLQKNPAIENGISLRVNRYLINKESARNDSYRVVFENINDFWFTGKGPGTFGGPSSTRYDSFLYDKYNFNWYGDHGLSTTDTYYPHLFVELGVLFGIIYLVVVLVFPILLSENKSFVIIIVLMLAVNSIFSFALNSINYCCYSLMLVFLVSTSSNSKIIEWIKE